MVEHITQKLGEEERKELIREFEISLLLNSYNGIFSDFDPRHYSERALSDDFLHESKKAVKDKPSGQIQLKLLIPQNKRNSNEEKVIKKRLRDHFKKHHTILEKDKKSIIKKGLAFTLSGIALMLITTFFLLNIEHKSSLITFLVVLFEPGGWFLFWEGLDQSIFESKKVNHNLRFYKRMSNAEIVFSSI